MKYRWLSGIIIAFVTIASGCIAYHFMRPAAACDCTAAEACDDLAWIRHEFRLAPSQLRRIEAVHGAYRVVCRKHCDMLAEARAGLAEARGQKRPADEIAAMETALGKLDGECKAGTTAYVQEIAGIIGGREGERYLGIVLPRVACFDHSPMAASALYGAPGKAHSTSTHERPGN